MLDNAGEKRAFRYLSYQQQDKILTLLKLNGITPAEQKTVQSQQSQLIHVLHQYKSHQDTRTVYFAKLLATLVSLASGISTLGFIFPLLSTMGIPLAAVITLTATIVFANTYLNFKLFKSKSGFIHQLTQHGFKDLLTYYDEKMSQVAPWSKPEPSLVKHQISTWKFALSSTLVIGASTVSAIFAFKGISAALVSVLGLSAAISNPIGLTLAAALFFGIVSLYLASYKTVLRSGPLGYIKQSLDKATKGKSPHYKLTLYSLSILVFILSVGMNIVGGLLSGNTMSELTKIPYAAGAAILISVNVMAQIAFNLELALKYGKKVIDTVDAMNEWIKKGHIRKFMLSWFTNFYEWKPESTYYQVIKILATLGVTPLFILFHFLENWMKVDTWLALFNGIANGAAPYDMISHSSSMLHNAAPATTAGAAGALDSYTTMLAADASPEQKAADASPEQKIEDAQRKSLKDTLGIELGESNGHTSSV